MDAMVQVFQNVYNLNTKTATIGVEIPSLYIPEGLKTEAVAVL